METFEFLTVQKAAGSFLRHPKSGPFRHGLLGKPNDDVASEIPENIAADFKEALRCRYVDAYNATVEMCRRAVQASCLQLGAPADKLVKQIDWLVSCLR